MNYKQTVARVADSKLDEYDEAMLDELIELVRDTLKGEDMGNIDDVVKDVRFYLEGEEMDNIDEDQWVDILKSDKSNKSNKSNKSDRFPSQEQTDLWLGIIQSFSPSDRDEWARAEAESEYEAYADAKYQEWKERDI